MKIILPETEGSIENIALLKHPFSHPDDLRETMFSEGSPSDSGNIIMLYACNTPTPICGLTFHFINNYFINKLIDCRYSTNLSTKTFYNTSFSQYSTHNTKIISNQQHSVLHFAVNVSRSNS